MYADLSDVLAGRRARAIAIDPTAPVPIFDPTDVRCARRSRRLAGLRFGRPSDRPLPVSDRESYDPTRPRGTTS